MYFLLKQNWRENQKKGDAVAGSNMIQNPSVPSFNSFYFLIFFTQLSKNNIYIIRLTTKFVFNDIIYPCFFCCFSEARMAGVIVNSSFLTLSKIVGSFLITAIKICKLWLIISGGQC